MFQSTNQIQPTRIPQNSIHVNLSEAVQSYSTAKNQISEIFSIYYDANELTNSETKLLLFVSMPECDIALTSRFGLLAMPAYQS